jgi:hypothetical protein
MESDGGKGTSRRSSSAIRDARPAASRACRSAKPASSESLPAPISRLESASTNKFCEELSPHLHCRPFSAAGALAAVLSVLREEEC